MLLRVTQRLRWHLNTARARTHYALNRLLRHRLAKRQFIKHLNYIPDLAAPKTHNEHILLRKLADHDPRFPRLSCKLAARDHIDHVLGAGTSDRLCVPVLAQAAFFDDLPRRLWSQDVMLKCTHGSGRNIAVPAYDSQTRSTARRKITRWLAEVYGWRRFEWAYLGLNPRIIAEPLLDGGDIRDLKLYFYDGTLRYIMPENNSGPIPEITVYTPDWTPLDMRWDRFAPNPGAPPKELAEAIAIATPLAQGFDALRIDFLITKKRLYLGELTLYDASGLSKFDSYQSDREFGQYWHPPKKAGRA